MALSSQIAVILFVAGLAYVMVLDVRRIRLRAAILSIADPATEIYRRNAPRKATRWGAGMSSMDGWLIRVTGSRWAGRAMFCILAGAVIAVLFEAEELANPQAHGSPILSMVASATAWPVVVFRRQLRKAEDDLVAARHLAEETSLRARLRQPGQPAAADRKDPSEFRT